VIRGTKNGLGQVIWRGEKKKRDIHLLKHTKGGNSLCPTQGEERSRCTGEGGQKALLGTRDRGNAKRYQRKGGMEKKASRTKGLVLNTGGAEPTRKTENERTTRKE